MYNVFILNLFMRLKIMNELFQRAIDLERNVAEMFERAGWECERGSKQYFDITLKRENKVIGYVETYILNPEQMLKKKERIFRGLEELKPVLFILTDGNTFETYIKGEYIYTTTVPLSYNSFTRVSRMIQYSKLMKENNDGNCN